MEGFSDCNYGLSIGFCIRKKKVISDNPDLSSQCYYFIHFFSKPYNNVWNTLNSALSVHLLIESTVWSVNFYQERNHANKAKKNSYG